jgi:hypothetical protein
MIFVIVQYSRSPDESLKELPLTLQKSYGFTFKAALMVQPLDILIELMESWYKFKEDDIP